MKIAVGTANFNEKYGIYKNKVKSDNLKKIFKIIKYNNIKYLDTAFDYNSSSKIRNYSNVNNLKILSKIKLPKKRINFFLEGLEKKITKELDFLKIKSFEALLFHDVKDLKSKYFKIFLKKILFLKKKKLIKMIGVSVYDPNDLKTVFLKFNPDIVQFSLNIFDDRPIKSKWFEILKKKKITIQIRSIFLQGILLKENKLIQKKKLNKKLRLKILEFNNWCKRHKISKLDACINFVSKIKGIKIITIGVNNSLELNQVLKAFKKNKPIKLKSFSTSDLSIIDPRKWKN
jgi:aryl-alcohol dehydrogenase-like predicted oxidoreductase